MKLSIETAYELMKKNGGNLYLRGTGVTSLPENLTVGGSLDLRGTGVTSLPENLTVGDWLDLRGTGITSLPENLTVGGWLDLRGTGITSTKNVKRLHNGDYADSRYLYADNILTHVKNKIVAGGYTYFEGKIPGKNVIFDGINYAHCKTRKQGLVDLRFKAAADRGADQYRDLPLDKELARDEMVTMYRIITGACQQGTQSFLDSLGDKLKDRYTIQEVIELTRGQYGGKRFAEFFQSRE